MIRLYSNDMINISGPKKLDQSDGAPSTNLLADDKADDFPNFPPSLDEELRQHFQRADLTWPPPMFPLEPPQPTAGTIPPEGLGELPPLLTLGREQQVAAVRLSHYVYTLMCIIWQQLTTIHRYSTLTLNIV